MLLYSQRRGMVVMVLLFLFASMTTALAAEEITLEPFRDEGFGITGLVPSGWNTAGPGLRVRGAGVTDVTLLAQQAAPAKADALWPTLLRQLQLDAVPEPVATYASPTGLEWKLYRVDVTAGTVTVAVDLALAEVKGKTYVLLLQTDVKEYEALHATVFTPALEAFAPLVTGEATSEPVPYLVEDVTFSNGDVTLGGTLTLPEGEGPFPAVVLVSGSGQQDRDESLAPVAAIKPFRLIADDLTRRGVAVLRYDDRGVGESTGDPMTATTEDFATDAAAAITYLLTRPEIRTDAVGLLGHSEGGIIAAMLGADDPRLAFVISMAGSGVPGREISLFQNRYSLRQLGLPDDTLTRILDLTALSFDKAIAGELDAAVETIRQLAALTYDSLPAEAQAQVGGGREAFIEAQVTQATAQFDLPWFKFFLSHDPAKDWARLTIPALVIFGGKDTQVDVELNRGPIEAALKQAGNTRYTIVTLPDANHLMQSAVTGDVSEYGTLKQEFTPDFLPLVGDWILETTGG